MNFKQCIQQQESILMEGALGERLKREYNLQLDEYVALAKLVYDSDGQFALKNIWQEYIQIAKAYQLPFLATTPTRRANKECVEIAGLDASIIIDNVQFLRGIQQESKIEMYIGGLMGCKSDAYTGKNVLSENDAHLFHSWQAKLFGESNVDFLFAGIMPTLPEATGMAKAMSDTGIPYIISFTIQSDGRLIDGTTIHDAIAYIDSAVTEKPTCYMTNCVHPRIVHQALSKSFNQSDLVQNRFWGIQANTSPLSYEELDGSMDLKCTEPESFAEDMLLLREINKIKIFGGCCGTDNRHMEQVAKRL